MKKITSALFASLAVISMSAAVASAQTATMTSATVSVANQAEIKALRAELDALKAKRDELKAKVAAGTMTKEAAKAEWESLITAFRAKKQAAFDSHIEKMSNRFKGLAEKDPELAGKIEAKVNALKDRRETVKAKHEELRAQVKAGTITREQANTARKEVFASTTARVKAAREDLRDLRDVRREDKREDRREDRREGRDVLPTTPIVPPQQ